MSFDTNYYALGFIDIDQFGVTIPIAPLHLIPFVPGCSFQSSFYSWPHQGASTSPTRIPRSLRVDVEVPGYERTSSNINEYLETNGSVVSNG